MQEFFTEAFDGVLITDLWAACDSVDAADRQKCIPHLLRELEKVDLHNDSAEWQGFAKKLRRLLCDGIRLRKRPDFPPKRYQSRIERLNRRVGEMAREEHADADARRLTKRLRRYGEYIFTFLDYPYAPADNNFGERQIRPAVILRKNSQSNRSDHGAGHPGGPDERVSHTASSRPQPHQNHRRRPQNLPDHRDTPPVTRVSHCK